MISWYYVPFINKMCQSQKEIDITRKNELDPEHTFLKFHHMSKAKYLSKSVEIYSHLLSCNMKWNLKLTNFKFSSICWTFYGLDKNTYCKSIILVSHFTLAGFLLVISQSFLQIDVLLEMELEHPCEAFEIWAEKQ